MMCSKVSLRPEYTSAANGAEILNVRQRSNYLTFQVLKRDLKRVTGTFLSLMAPTICQSSCKLFSLAAKKRATAAAVPKGQPRMTNSLSGGEYETPRGTEGAVAPGPQKILFGGFS